MSKASYTPLDTNPREDFIEKQVDVLPRLCCLTRNNRECEYGFSLRTLKSNGLHVAIDVSKSLPASISGLKEGDFILEINGESIDGMEHSQVVQLVSTRPTSVHLLTINDFNAYFNYKNYMKKLDEVKSENVKECDKETTAVCQCQLYDLGIVQREFDNREWVKGFKETRGY